MTTDLECYLSRGIPLHEASRFLLQIKTAAQPTEPPDETGVLEGQFAAPVEQVLVAMGQQVQNEFETHMSYKVYAQTLRDLSHHAIAEEFEEHADEEMEHADFLLRRMAALGGPAHIPDVQAPAASADPIEIIKRMIRMEQESIAAWRQLRQLVGDQNPTAVAIDDYMLKEQEHSDDLWQLLPHTERQVVATQAPQQQPQAAEPSAVPAQEKQAYYRVPYDAHYDSYYGAYRDYDPYEEQKMRHMHELAQIEELQGQLRQARTPEEQEAIKQQFRQDQIDSSRIGGAIAGGLLGGVGLGALGNVIAKGNPGATVLGAMGGAALGGVLGHGLGKSMGISKSRRLINRAYAGTLPVDGLPMPQAPAAGPGEDQTKMGSAWKDVASARFQSALAKLAAEQADPEHVVRGLEAYKQVSKQLGQPVGEYDLALMRYGLLNSRPTPELARQHLDAYREYFGDEDPPDVQQYNAAILGRTHLEAFNNPKELAAYKAHPDLAYAFRHIDRSGMMSPSFKPSKEYARAMQQKAASMRLVKAAADLGLVGQEMPPEQYLAQEQMMQQVQDTNEANFYKQRFQEAQAQLQAAQQAQQSQQQQMDQLNQQLQSLQAQIDGVMQNAQQVQQSAMQNAQSAQASATQAMQQTLAANSELLSQQQLSANMRNAYQQLQQQLMQVAQQAPPPATTTEAGMAQAAPVGGAPQLGMQEQAGMPPDAGADGMSPGQPGAEAGAGAPPAGGPAPGGQGPEAGGAPADNMQPMMQGAVPQSDQSAPQPEAAMAAKQGSVSDLEKHLMMQAKQHAPQVIGGAVGAAVGAMLPFALKGGDEQLAALRQQIAEQEARRGELGWKEELGLIKNKSQLELEEFAQKNPAAAHLIGAATIAGVGAGAGTAVGHVLAKHKANPLGY